MNIIIIGNKLETQPLKRLIEKEMMHTCAQIEFSTNLHERLQRNYWDLIIVAVGYKHMPAACDALYLIKKINPDSHVILISANKDVNLLTSALETGVSHFLVQPFSTQILLEKIIKEVKLMQLSMKKKRVLAIGAHPDDVEIGCGATLVKHKNNKDEITILTLTRGASGGDTSIRYQESAKASHYLNANLLIKDLTDTKVTDGPDTIKAIEEAIETTKADIIYTHSINDTHQDHRHTHYATLVAARKVDQIYSYLSPSCTINFHPLRFEHVEDYINSKIELISFYESQKQKCAYLNNSLIRSTAEYWGRFAKYGLVEPFEVIRS